MGEPLLNWSVSEEDALALERIVLRAKDQLAFVLAHVSAHRIGMDIQAAHCNGCPLDLEALADAAPVDFAHDVVGICTHLNRRTGKLEDCFLPRHARKEERP